MISNIMSKSIISYRNYKKFLIVCLIRDTFAKYIFYAKRYNSGALDFWGSFYLVPFSTGQLYGLYCLSAVCTWLLTTGFPQ